MPASLKKGHVVPRFAPGPCTDTVLVSTDDGQRTAAVPRPLALRLWAGLPAHACGRGGYVALALAVDPTVDRPDMFICLSEDDGTPPPWPAWAADSDDPSWLFM